VLRAAGPWGQGFPEPLFDGEFKVLDAKIVGGKHMKMNLELAGGGSPAIEAIAFGYAGAVHADAADGAPPRHGATVQLAYRLEINEFRGSERVQLNCQHVSLS
jgi:single-stranded-DNA-specific exonuclease